MIYDGKEISFAAVRCHYWTGQSVTIRGSYGEKKTAYRSGVQTDVGDIEVATWEKLVQALIEEAGEQSLYDAMVEWLREHNYAKEKEKDLRRKAYSLHASRIFDNELWVDFIAFNDRFRPGFTDTVELIEIIPECCREIGKLPVKALSARSYPVRGRVCCPHCGRSTTYSFPDGTRPDFETPDWWSDDDSSATSRKNVVPISDAELAIGSERSVERVIPLLHQCGLKYRLGDFKYRSSDGVLRNSDSVNTVSYLSYARMFVVTLSNKCPRMGKKLKNAVKQDRQAFTNCGGNVIYQAVQFHFDVGELLPDSPTHREDS